MPFHSYREISITTMILNSIKLGQGTNNDNNSNGTIADHVYDDQKEDPPAASGKIILLTYVSSIS